GGDRPPPRRVARPARSQARPAAGGAIELFLPGASRSELYRVAAQGLEVDAAKSQECSCPTSFKTFRSRPPQVGSSGQSATRESSTSGGRLAPQASHAS